MTEIWLYNFQQIKPCKNQCSNLRHQKEEEVVEVWWDAGRQGGIIGQKKRGIEKLQN
jgi:ribosomal protein S3